MPAPAHGDDFSGPGGRVLGTHFRKSSHAASRSVARKQTRDSTIVYPLLSAVPLLRPLCLTTVSHCAHICTIDLLMYPLDVEHAVAEPGKQAHTTVPLPQLQYEGFEPSPFQADDVRAEMEEGPVRHVAPYRGYYTDSATGCNI